MGRGRDLRIGDPEREIAMRLLGEHFAVGRLDVGEYDERCRQVAAARFRSELEGLFDDLPAPRPERAVPAPRAPISARPQPVKIALAVGVAVLAVLLLIVARQAALVLLIPLIAVLWFTWRR